MGPDSWGRASWGGLSCQPRWLDLTSWVMRKQNDPMPGSKRKEARKNQRAKTELLGGRPPAPGSILLPDVCVAPGPPLLPGAWPRTSHTHPRRREPQAERPQLLPQDILSPPWPQRLCLSLGFQPSCWGGLAHCGQISPICPGTGSCWFLSACVWYIRVCKVLVTKIVSLNPQEPWVAGQGHETQECRDRTHKNPILNVCAFLKPSTKGVLVTTSLGVYALICEMGIIMIPTP